MIMASLLHTLFSSAIEKQEHNVLPYNHLSILHVMTVGLTLMHDDGP